jgi:putative tryptophan/tyrosine transport system substrate-binding protein
MKRREFITLLGGAAAASLLCPITARAQRQRPRVAVLSLNTMKDEGKIITTFTAAMVALGYVSGQIIDIDYRYADGDTTRLRPLVLELLALKPEVAVVTSLSPVRAVKDAAPDLPMVCPGLSDSAFPTFAASYAHPGGSLTGIASSVENMYEKLLELALDTVPGLARVGFLVNPAGAAMTLYTQQIETAARTRGIALLTEQARTPDDLAVAFDGFAKQEAQAVIVPANALFITHGTQIAQLALAARLPSIFPDFREVEAGGLASYGVDVRENYRRAAVYVDKILKGAKPGDLPIEFPTKLALIVNLKTAKTLGLKIPAALLNRADEVIE